MQYKLTTHDEAPIDVFFNSFGVRQFNGGTTNVRVERGEGVQHVIVTGVPRDWGDQGDFVVVVQMFLSGAGASDRRILSFANKVSLEPSAVRQKVTSDSEARR